MKGHVRKLNSCQATSWQGKVTAPTPEIHNVLLTLWYFLLTNEILSHQEVDFVNLRPIIYSFSWALCSTNWWLGEMMYGYHSFMGRIIDFFFFFVYPNSLKCYKSISKCYWTPIKRQCVCLARPCLQLHTLHNSAGASQHLPIMPLTVPKSTEPWVGVELSPRFCSTSEPWQKTLTNSPRWKTPTSCRCCRSSSVVAALIARWRRRRKKKKEENWDHGHGSKTGTTWVGGVGGGSRDKSKAIQRINMEGKKKQKRMSKGGEVGNVFRRSGSMKWKKNKARRDEQACPERSSWDGEVMETRGAGGRWAEWRLQQEERCAIKIKVNSAELSQLMN